VEAEMKTIKIDDATHRQMKILSAETGLYMTEILEKLVGGESLKSIREKYSPQKN
jgi:hypothetical protein